MSNTFADRTGHRAERRTDHSVEERLDHVMQALADAATWVLFKASRVRT